MYAVVRTGGKQYRVGTGDILEIEKIEGDIGQEITLADILLVSNGERMEIGQPTVENASVQAVITGQYRGPKILSFRYRPKKRIRVRRGHRQYITRLEIKSLSLNGETITDVMELGPTPKTQPKKEKKTYIPVAAPASEVVEEAVEASVESVESVEVSVESVEASVTDAVDTASDAVEAAADAGTNAVADAGANAVDAVVDAASDVADDAVDAAADAVDGAADAVDGDSK